MNQAKEALDRLQKNIGQVIIGKPETIRLSVITLLAKGHLLIEDVPGVGKTSMAHALAQSLDLDFRRIQFTNDILPSDVTGVSIFNQKEARFEFKPGPIFANIVLTDEINRSTPRTQSALLEAMNERQVTVDNATYHLEDPFMVIATQNPIESHGAYPLPESQLDRFMMYVSMGYPTLEDEKRLLTTHTVGNRIDQISPVMDKGQVIDLQKQVDGVRMEPIMVDYILSIVSASRNSKHLSLGVSPRGGLIFQHAARACALVDGRDFVLPDDIKEMSGPVLSHRVIPETRQSGTQRRFGDAAAIVNDIVESLEIPV